TAFGPMSARTVASASFMSLARKVRSSMTSDLAHGAELHARVDLGLRHHHGLRPEALDDRANEGADLRARQQHRHFVLLARLVEAVAHRLDEGLELRRRHGELAFLALADDRLREGLLPGRRQSNERKIAGQREIGVAELAREAGADMLGDVHGV